MSYALAVFRIVSFVFLLLGFQCLAVAKTWEYIVTSDTGNQYFFDIDSIKRTGSEVFYTQLSNYPSPRKIASGTILSVVQYKVSNCSKKTFSTSKLVAFSEQNAKGSVVHIEVPESTKLYDIIDGKIADDIQNAVCGYHI